MQFNPGTPWPLALSLALLTFQEHESAPLLVVGETVEAELASSAQEVHTPTLDARDTTLTARGVEFRIVVEEAGTYHIDLRSYDFDPYLILRDASGGLLAEDDDGLSFAHARLVIELEPGAEVQLMACARRGAGGAYRLDLISGAPAPISPTEKARLDLQEARATLAHLETRLGADHPRTTSILGYLVSMLSSMAEYEQALPLMERLLAIREAELGPDHPVIATHASNLGYLLHSMGEFEQAKPFIERALAIREAQLGPQHLSTAGSLYSLAISFRSLGDYESARPLMERALVIREAQLGPDHPTVGTTLEGLALAHEAMGERELAKPLLERALAIHEARLGPDHPSTAMTLTSLARVLSSMGEYPEAMGLLERALAIRESNSVPDHPDTAKILNNMGILLNRKGEYARARSHFERALAICEASLGPEHPDTAASIGNLGDLLRDMGDLARARPFLERSLAITEDQLGPDHPDTATGLSSLAALFRSLGDLAAAMPLEERALASREAHFGPNHPMIAVSLGAMGLLLRAMGDHEQSRSLLERALAIDESHWGPRHGSTAISLGNLAASFQITGEFERAKPLMERVLAIHEATLGPDHPSTAISLSHLGVLLRSMGEYEQAKPLLERALAINEICHGVGHPMTAMSSSHLAELLRSTGDLEQARRFSERALAINMDRLGAGHPQTITDLNNLAIILLDLREPTSAWELLRGRQGGMREHLTGILGLRTRTESRRYLSMRRWEQELLQSVPRCFSSPEVEAGAASGLLAWKGQIGRSARRVRELTRRSPAASELSDLLGTRQRELSQLAYDTELPAAVREMRLEEVRQEIGHLEVELRGLVGIDPLESWDIDALVGRISPNTALLSYFVHKVYQPARYEGDEVIEGGSWSPAHLIAWVIRPGAEVVSVDLGLADLVERRVRGFLDVLVQGRGVSLGGADDELNAALRSSLWDPLVEHLGDASLVIVSHDQFTATLPFGILMDAQGRYLVEERSFVYLHDLLSIAEFDEQVPRAYDSLFCVGGVDFNDRSEAEQVAVTAMRGASGAPTERWQYWGPLDSTRSEATTIRGLHEAFVPDGSRSLVLGSEATEERVVSEMRSASLVHLATHGYFRPQGLPSMWQAAKEELRRSRELGGAHMMGELLVSDRKLSGYLPEVLSGLVLAGANLERDEARLDGYLTAADLDWMDLSGVELVTLSACETGLGRSESGEGMSGFRSTLLRAGARTVVSSLWQVPDDSTERLMSRFYENILRHKLGKLEALREAQLWMLRENRRRFDGRGRPFTWGAFVLSGDWR